MLRRGLVIGMMLCVVILLGGCTNAIKDQTIQAVVAEQEMVDKGSSDWEWLLPVVEAYVQQTPVEIVLEEYSCSPLPQQVTARILAKIEEENSSRYQVAVETVREVTPTLQKKGDYEQLYVSGQDAVRLEERYWVSVDEDSRQITEIIPAPIDYYARLPFQGIDVLPELEKVVRESVRSELEVGLKEEWGHNAKLDWAQMEVKMSCYSTQKQPRFVVSLPVSLLRNHYNKVYYRYNYFVGTKEEQIEWIRLIRIEPVVP